MAPIRKGAVTVELANLPEQLTPMLAVAAQDSPVGNDWTTDGKLQRPIFLGVRDNKSAHSVVREPPLLVATDSPMKKKAAEAKAPKKGSTKAAPLVAQLNAIEAGSGDGTLDLGRDGRLALTSLGKVFFPRPRRTKGDLLRYYAQISAALLPAIRDRPLSLRAIPKTSGASGMHGVIPLPKGVDEQSARLLAELVATNVARRDPQLATVVRSVKARARGTVYVDFLQNIRGKSVAGVYSVRAFPFGTVSTPLDWSEVEESLDPREFTMDVVVERFAKRGDLWAKGMKASNSLHALTGDKPARAPRKTASASRSSRPRSASSA